MTFKTLLSSTATVILEFWPATEGEEGNCSQNTAMDVRSMSECGRVLLSLYSWIQKFEFPILFTCQEIGFLLCFYATI